MILVVSSLRRPLVMPRRRAAARRCSASPTRCAAGTGGRIQEMARRRARHVVRRPPKRCWEQGGVILWPRIGRLGNASTMQQPVVVPRRILAASDLRWAENWCAPAAAPARSQAGDRAATSPPCRRSGAASFAIVRPSPPDSDVLLDAARCSIEADVLALATHDSGRQQERLVRRQTERQSRHQHAAGLQRIERLRLHRRCEWSLPAGDRQSFDDVACLHRYSCTNTQSLMKLASPLA